MTDRTRQLAIDLTGAVTERGTSRAASRWICRDCGAQILRALDGDILAFEATIDPTPTTAVGELVAVTTGRRTYDGIRVKGRLELEPRRPVHIPTRRHPVYAEHRCGQPLPADTSHTHDQELPDEPPF